MTDNTTLVDTLRAIVDHIEQHQLTAMSVYTSRNDAPTIAVYDAQELRAWLNTLTGPGQRVTVQQDNDKHVCVKVYAIAGVTSIELHYPCNARREPGLYRTLAAVADGSGEPVEVDLAAILAADETATVVAS